MFGTATWRKLKVFFSISTLTLLFVFFQNFAPESSTVASVRKSKWHDSKLVIKFNDDFAEQLEQNINMKNMHVEKQHNVIISDFMKRHHILKLRPMHRDVVRRKKATGLNEVSLVNSIKKQFPARNSRESVASSNSLALSKFYVAEIDKKSLDVNSALQGLMFAKEVEVVEPMTIFNTTYNNTNPYAYFSYNTTFQNSLNVAWDLVSGTGGAGAGQIVAVLDTGLDVTHLELQGRVYGGYNFIAENTNVDDDYGHGTHVTGTIVAANNGLGILGLAWGSRVMPLKVLDNGGGGELANVAEGIVYAANNGADVINMSLGAYMSDGVGNASLETAIDYAYSLGVVTVAAAGNSSGITDSSFIPAGFPEVIAVSAYAIDETRASFSNYGNKIDVAAPGVNIISLRAAHSDPRYHNISDAGYSYASGTSMAAPHVAAAAAVILSKNPNATVEQVRKILQYSARDIGAAGFDIYSGHGMLDLGKAVRNKKAFDFDGDGKSDIFWRNSSTGANSIWKSASNLTTQNVAAASRLLQIQAVADFNGDGVSDVFFRNTTEGSNVIWYGADSTVRSFSNVPDLNWKVKGAGDFDWDGKSDLLWRNNLTGENKIWRSGSSGLEYSIKSVSDFNWSIATIADFYGDGKSDILWRNNITGQNMIWRNADGVNSSQNISSETDLNWIIVGAGDFYNDTKADIVWQNSVTGQVRLWKNADAVNGNILLGTQSDVSWKILAIGDYNNDYKSDILWRHGVSGSNVIWLNGSSTKLLNVTSQTDLNWTIPPTERVLWGPLSDSTPHGTQLLLANSVSYNPSSNICGDWSVSECDGSFNLDNSVCGPQKKYSTNYKSYQCQIPPVGTQVTCPSVKLALQMNWSDGSKVSCEGFMPAASAGANEVYGSDPKGQFSQPGFSGSECLIGNTQGAHYHVLSGRAIGKCNYSCTLIADCGSNGYWKNIRYTW